MDASVVAKVKEWIGHCLTTHLACRALVPRQVRYPTRLLDVRAWHQTGILNIIQVPKGFDSDYVALSYCWGKKDDWWIQYVEASQQGGWEIEGDKMPQTYQDAVAACIALGYSYLWVDCLCIKQGDMDDWLTESAKMSDVYTNAILVISASDAVSCGAGFLQDRPPLQRDGAVMHILDDDGTVGLARLCPPNTDFQTLVGDGPVAQRAWCLQERQLAPRVLHICQAEVFFECVRCRRYESEKIPGAEFDTSDESGYHFNIPDRNFHSEAKGKPPGNVVDVLSWFVIVQDYANRSLFDAGDKLIAIAGLARRAHDIIKGDYLAGIWRKYVHFGLAWMVENTAIATRAPESPYRAPSWSWASMDGPVTWKDLGHDMIAKSDYVKTAMDIMDTTVRLAASDPFGAVLHAELIVSGQLRTASSDMLLHNEVLHYQIWERESRYWPPSIRGWYLEDEKRPWKNEERICLNIMTREVFGNSEELVHTVLLLEIAQGPNSDGAHGDGLDNIKTYKRVGYGEIMAADFFDDCPAQRLRLV
ncbi:hypothetical protein PV08_05354 [Exophiala spinifera]|uniref:Heterokaryon incompatibility domain-containing protein n=1 Tax=Exophiala spinifera TaxID=91928 RepID=A0A0D2BVJ6_9EURO|nr:uncharacterized protein PV08_05354 [Exophiala spinifera]KIW15309.1 hypothetical protein PV08_05354 [Exophiala spinifera]